MSYERRGHYGGRRRYRDDWNNQRHEPVETPDDKLKSAIIKFGEVDANEELVRLETQIRDHVPRNIPLLSEAFRISVTEQPYKIPHYATLLRVLHNKGDTPTEDEVPLGRLILEDFWKGFQGYVDKLAWREVRLCIHFFAHLTVAKLISADSMLALLQSFTAVLDEFGVSNGRAKRAALCAGEGLLIGGPALKAHSAISSTEIINSIQQYNDTLSSEKWLVSPTFTQSVESPPLEGSIEFLDMLLTTLRALDETNFEETKNCLPRPYEIYPPFDPSVLRPYDLPIVLVPPEAIELDAMSPDTSEGETLVKKDEWPEYFIRLFPSDVSPDYTNPIGYMIRTAILDIVDIFEVNRKECARLLLEYPKWNLPGTFKPRPGSTVAVEPAPGKDWQLESTIIETILSTYLLLPESNRKSIYYISLITEICKLSPSTVGPAVGKSIRRLYHNLAEGLDVEAARKFAEWFAVHMSNFGFQWVWKEWIPDLELTVQHPKRAFMRRAIEFEIRLAYHERIFKTLPEPMQGPDAYVIPAEGPSPAFEYDASHPHHDAAEAILNLFRGRAKAEDVISHLDELRTKLESSEEGHVNVDTLVRSIAVQSLLQIGSRSFSHLLNAIERYLPLLRNLAGASAPGATTTGATATAGSNPEARTEILSAAAAFWKHNRQMVGIVFDKLMQYQIVDPTDIVAWTFLNGASVGQLSELGGPMNLSAFEWDLLRAAIDKANGRVVAARRRVMQLRKEADERRALSKAKAENGNDMDMDVENKEEEKDDDPQLVTALKAYSSLTKEQRMVLSRTLEGFVESLAPAPTARNPNPHARTVIDEAAWENRASWGRDEWNAWETWGWYKQFCRAYAPYLRTYVNTLYTVSLAKFEGAKDPGADMLKKIWNVATGQEA
ncbi:cap binding protein 80-PB [Coprinopsis cinerea okayama7|uniref:Cap binding protein 80-PB n=1 Tax=Coprinopsis cinerea (strain Okayama-7 / 130 / ATCC MYA-4618 / FGSC 9003) TaxID=240176 RepID=A8PGT3_COPC7|nr:cap binding protein 80-PB [Coprinopsis cinerea okayama7\|eukprot:XP_001841275.1 cap binding protein 80-PB [Coprinopsis cinerea okayama7\